MHAACRRQLQRAQARHLRHPRPQERFLKGKSVTPKTVAIYRGSAAAFARWARDTGRRSTAGKHLDRAMEAYFDHLYFLGHNPSRGRYAMYGTGFVRDLVVSKHTFTRSVRALKSWANLAKERERWPITWPALVAVALHLAQLGKVDSARICLLQFDLYLRAAEASDLRWSQVTPPTPNSVPRVWAVRVAPSDEFAEGSRADLSLAQAGAGRNAPSKTGTFDQTVLVGEAASDRAGRSIVAVLLSKWRRARWALRFPFHSHPGAVREGFRRCCRRSRDGGHATFHPHLQARRCQC